MPKRMSEKDVADYDKGYYCQFRMEKKGQDMCLGHSKCTYSGPHPGKNCSRYSSCEKVSRINEDFFS